MQKISINIQYISPYEPNTDSFVSDNLEAFSKKDDVINIIFILNRSTFWNKTFDFVYKDKNFSVEEKKAVVHFLQEILEKPNHFKTNNDALLYHLVLSEKALAKKKILNPENRWLIDWAIGHKDMEKIEINTFENFLNILPENDFDKVPISSDQGLRLVNNVLNKSKLTAFGKKILQKVNLPIETCTKNLSQPINNETIDFLLTYLEKIPKFSSLTMEDNFAKIVNNKDSIAQDGKIIKYKSVNYYKQIKNYDCIDEIILLISNKNSYSIKNVNLIRPDLINNIGFNKIYQGLITISSPSIFGRNLVELLKIFPEKTLSESNYLEIKETSKSWKTYLDLMQYYFKENKVNEANLCFKTMELPMGIVNSELKNIEDWLELQNTIKPLINKKSIIL